MFEDGRMLKIISFIIIACKNVFRMAYNHKIPLVARGPTRVHAYKPRPSRGSESQSVLDVGHSHIGTRALRFEEFIYFICFRYDFLSRAELIRLLYQDFW